MKKSDRASFDEKNRAFSVKHELGNCNIIMTMTGESFICNKQGKGITGKAKVILIGEDGKLHWIWPWNYREMAVQVEKQEVIEKLRDKYPNSLQYLEMKRLRMTCPDHEIMLKALAAYAYDLDYVSELEGVNCVNVIGLWDTHPCQMEDRMLGTLNNVIHTIEVDKQRLKAGLPTLPVLSTPEGLLFKTNR